MRPTSPCLSAADPGLPLDAFAEALADPRAFPSEAALTQVGRAVMTELLDLLLGGALEDHVGVAAESLIGGLHTAVLRLERSADRSRDALARGLREFDGSEVADHDLQEAKAQTDVADAAVRAVERLRDAAAETYATATGDTWTPWRGGVRPSGATAAQIDAAHALRTREALRLAQSDPGSQVVAFRGAPGAVSPEDATRIFDALNWAHRTWPDMSLAITGAPGAEQIAKRWAAQKRVRIVLARPDFERHGRAAPFRANDALMALQPVCVLTLAASLQPDGSPAKPFGPVLSLVQSAQAAGVRCVRIRRADLKTSPPG
jgi:hypothetical protein